MLAFSNDYYGLIFRATQSVELFCAYILMDKCRKREEYINRMVENLPLLRTATSLTQEQLAEKVGVSRQTIIAIEKKKRCLSWTLYLALIAIFIANEKSNELIRNLKIFDILELQCESGGNEIGY